MSKKIKVIIDDESLKKEREEFFDLGMAEDYSVDINKNPVDIKKDFLEGIEIVEEGAFKGTIIIEDNCTEEEYPDVKLIKEVLIKAGVK